MVNGEENFKLFFCPYLSRTIAANFQSPEIFVVLSSSFILSVMILISFRINSSSCFTGGDIEKLSRIVFGGDLKYKIYSFSQLRQISYQQAKGH